MRLRADEPLEVLPRNRACQVFGSEINSAVRLGRSDDDERAGQVEAIPDRDRTIETDQVSAHCSSNLSVPGEVEGGARAGVLELSIGRDVAAATHTLLLPHEPQRRLRSPHGWRLEVLVGAGTDMACSEVIGVAADREQGGHLDIADPVLRDRAAGVELAPRTVDRSVTGTSP